MGTMFKNKSPVLDMNFLAPTTTGSFRSIKFNGGLLTADITNPDLI